MKTPHRAVQGLAGKRPDVVSDFFTDLVAKWGEASGSFTHTISTPDKTLISWRVVVGAIVAVFSSLT